MNRSISEVITVDERINQQLLDDDFKNFKLTKYVEATPGMTPMKVAYVEGERIEISLYK